MLWTFTNFSSPCSRITGSFERATWVCLSPSGPRLSTEITSGGYSLTFIDEFAYELMTEERVCDIILPRLQKRQILEENGEIGPRKSRLLAAMEDKSEDGSTRGRSRSRSPDTSPSSGSASRSRSPSDASRYVSRSPSRSRSPSLGKSENDMNIDEAA